MKSSELQRKFAQNCPITFDPENPYPRVRKVRKFLREDECPDCGEQAYSPEAMEKIEAHRPQRSGFSKDTA